MKQNLTELVFVLDKSGSMAGLESDTIGGYNSLLEKQKKEDGEAVVSTVLFNDEVDLIHDRVNLSQIEKLTDKEYFVGGCTALLDAVGTTIKRVNKIRNELKEEYIPSKTLFVIITDGYENASKEYSYQKIKEMIQKQKEAGWEFIFLGANIDAIEEASKVGISEDRAVSYCCDPIGVDINYCALDCAISSMRKTGMVEESWSLAIGRDFDERGKKGAK